MVEIKTTHPKLTDSEITKFEWRWNIKLPQKYRDFLLQYNGGTVQPDIFRYEREDSPDAGFILSFFLPINQKYQFNIEHYLEIYAGRIPKAFLPIADTAGGDPICLKITGDDIGSIYFWSHEHESEEEDYLDNLYYVAKDIDELLNGLSYYEDEEDEIE
jgi:hypothetical protein